MKAWKFIGKDHRLRYRDGRELIPGQALRDPVGQDGKVVTVPVPCESGFHASVLALDALEFAGADMTDIARVELGGQIVPHNGDKHTATEITCLWVADAERTLHEFAIWCGYEALQVGYPDGDAPLASLLALHVKELWLAGDADDSDLDAAWDAARDAARDAAGAAAGDAARAAARDAASAAARDAARAAQNEELERRLLALARKAGGG